MARLPITCAIAFALTAMSAAAESYPTRPITLIVPFPAGGTADILARTLAEPLAASLGQPVVVQNVAGAGGSLGAIRGAQAAPDGYTLSIGNLTSHVGSGAMYRLPFDLLSDLQPVSLLTFAPLMIIGRNDLAARNGAELIAWLKQNPDKVSFATIGSGIICGMHFQEKIGTHFRFVPYSGAAPAMRDLVGGHVDLMCAEASQTLPLIRSGKLQAFTVMSERRWPPAPEIPTVGEVGAAGAHMSFWHGLWVPKGTPDEIVAKLTDAVRTSLAHPGLQKKLAEMGVTIARPDQQSAAALATHHKREVERWWPMIKAANVKPE